MEKIVFESYDKDEIIDYLLGYLERVNLEREVHEYLEGDEGYTDATYYIISEEN